MFFKGLRANAPEAENQALRGEKKRLENRLASLGREASEARKTVEAKAAEIKKQKRTLRRLKGGITLAMNDARKTQDSDKESSSEEEAEAKDGARRLRVLLDHVPLGDLPELLNLQDGDGYTPLHWAASEASTSTIRLLLGYGADVAVPGRRGVLPLGTLLENTYWQGARWGGGRAAV